MKEIKCRKQFFSVFLNVLNTYCMAVVRHKFGALCRVLVGGRLNVEGVYSDSVCDMAECVTSSGRRWHGREGSRDA